MTLLMGATARCGHVVTIEESDDLCDEDKYEAVYEAIQELCPDCEKATNRTINRRDFPEFVSTCWACGAHLRKGEGQYFYLMEVFDSQRKRHTVHRDNNLCLRLQGRADQIANVN